MTETFLGIFEEGPFPGNYEYPKQYDGGWPLPKYVKAKGHDMGCYVKYWESSGAPKSTEQARGAKYKWAEASAGHDLAN